MSAIGGFVQRRARSPAAGRNQDVAARSVVDECTHGLELAADAGERQRSLEKLRGWLCLEQLFQNVHPAETGGVSQVHSCAAKR